MILRLASLSLFVLLTCTISLGEQETRADHEILRPASKNKNNSTRRTRKTNGADDNAPRNKEEGHQGYLTRHLSKAKKKKKPKEPKTPKAPKSDSSKKATNAPSPAPACSSEQQCILLAFYEGITNRNETLVDWFPTSGGINECTWSGIFCDTFGTVTGIELPSKNLSGKIAPEIGGLSNLVFLTLHTNNLSGTIPSALGGLEKLDRLYLQKNDLTGTMPLEICNLRSTSTPAVGVLTTFWVDCYNDIEVNCPDGCCTRCCNLSGSLCQANR